MSPSVTLDLLGRSRLWFVDQDVPCAANTDFRYSAQDTESEITYCTYEYPLSHSFLVTQLSELATRHFDDKFGLWGIVKETNVDDQGLLDFYQQYFTFDIYRDELLATYEAMGNRMIRLTTWNPIRWYRGFWDLTSRLQQKNIKGNLKGEGMLQGGILFFDKAGVLQFAYEEEIGDEFDVEEILAVLKLMESGTTSKIEQEL